MPKSQRSSTKRKIINDPVYGFINISSDLLFDLIQHPYFQRLRRIKQLGLTDLVYPGASHTRFHHALGAMHLMSLALDNLRAKGNEISAEEYEAAQVAILLHDIGHGPFSHTLESTLLENVKHEEISRIIMERLKDYYGTPLQRALQMFNGSYPRPFFHQLISSQLDIDRMDYLRRDSFFTGVSEGTIGSQRILKMLDVAAEELVVEEKGIYTIEHFLNARRVMYWQVYLHKTTVAAEKMMVNTLQRARQLEESSKSVKTGYPMDFFLSQSPSLSDFESDNDLLEAFMLLDDSDVLGTIKNWQRHGDQVLSELSTRLLQRKLFRCVLQARPLDQDRMRTLVSEWMEKNKLCEEDAYYFFSRGTVSNAAYLAREAKILVRKKDGSILDISEASDLPNIKAMSKIVTKHYFCFPKSLSL